ncbi:MAG: YncE family protein [Bacteroidales bacterium]|jgi:DNA-binding beta-propeller fold protein YncE|nr:YncE family protein [Bacteroidales bacterium]
MTKKLKSVARTTHKRKFLGAIVCLALCMNACKPPQKETDTIFGNGVLVLCEGLMSQNNSALSYYNFDTETLTYDVFNEKNQRSLGDNASDMQIYGSKLYIVVNNSNRLEIIDLHTGVSLKGITFFDADNRPQQPNHIAFYGSNAYVSCYDGTICRIDTASLTVDKSVQAGQNPEGLCATAGKLYVCNSGGFNYPNYDSTVSVFDLATLSEIKKINLTINPRFAAADKLGNVYIFSQGNYNDVMPTLQRIDTQADVVVNSALINNASKFCIAASKAYIFGYDYFSGQTVCKSFSLPSLTEIGDCITDGTEIKVPYALFINELTEDLYIADAIDYTSDGKVYVFGADGKQKKMFSTAINPNTILLSKQF